MVSWTYAFPPDAWTRLVGGGAWRRPGGCQDLRIWVHIPKHTTCRRHSVRAVVIAGAAAIAAWVQSIHLASPLLCLLETPLKVSTLVPTAGTDWPVLWPRRAQVPARNAMFGILQAKLAEHKLKFTVNEVERKVIKVPQESML